MQKLRILSATGVLLAVSAAETLARAGNPSTADCLSSANQSLDLRRAHKLQAARLQLLVCTSASCPADLRNECIRRLSDVNAAIPTIVFETKDALGNDVAAVKVTVDGQVLAERLEGLAVSIDPGEHSFAFEAPGQPTVQKTFVVREAEKNRRERIQFGPVAQTPAAPTPIAASPPPAESSVPAAHAGLGTQRILALASAGVGLVGVGVGTFFGLRAMSKRDDAHNVCPNATCSDQGGVDLWNDALTSATLSTVGFVVGAAGLVGGAVLWVTAHPPASEAPTVHLGASLGRVELGGTW